MLCMFNLQQEFGLSFSCGWTQCKECVLSKLLQEKLWTNWDQVRQCLIQYIVFICYLKKWNLFQIYYVFMTSIVIDIFEYSPGKYVIIKSTKNKTKPYLDEPTTKNGYCQSFEWKIWPTGIM